MFGLKGGGGACHTKKARSTGRGFSVVVVSRMPERNGRRARASGGAGAAFDGDDPYLHGQRARQRLGEEQLRAARDAHFSGHDVVLFLGGGGLRASAGAMEVLLGVCVCLSMRRGRLAAV